MKTATTIPTAFRVAPDLLVRILPNEAQTPPGKLADAELVWTGGPLEGCKLTGFAVWERRGQGARNVTFPARTYSVNGERRAYALLRPEADGAATERVRALVLDGFDQYDRAAADAAVHTPVAR